MEYNFSHSELQEDMMRRFLADLINNNGAIGLTDHSGNQALIRAICVSNSSR